MIYDLGFTILVNRRSLAIKKDDISLRFTQGKRENDLFHNSIIYPLSPTIQGYE